MIGAKIRYFRQMKGITQEQLASGICSIPYLSKIEHGLAQPSEELVEHLCNELGVSLEQVDDEDKISEMTKYLKDWYREMRIRDLEQVENKKKKIEKEFENIEDPILLTTYLLFKFRYHLLNLELDKSNTLLERLYIVQESLNHDLEFYYYYFLGLYYYQLKKFSDSLEVYKKAEKLSKTMNLDVGELSEFYYQKALVHGRLYQVALSNNHAVKALSLFNQEYNFKRSADIEVLLGINNLRILNYEEATNHFKNTLKYAESFNDKYLKSIVYHNLGLVSAAMGLSLEALDYYKSGLQYINEDDSEEVVQTIYLIATEYSKLNKIENAEKWLATGLKQALNNEVINYVYHFKILEHHVKQTYNSDYEVLLKEEAIPYFEEKQSWKYVTDYCEKLADYYNHSSQYKNASYYYRLANDARKKIIN
ncbi:helix-turn-helix domain-containing protein [Guptibacillus hwajinpoensis]|uniref:helix-turn-helix domain-containing protein n=1 Tax=Bacillales TaxID=1385 RepID=UPI00385140B3